MTSPPSTTQPQNLTHPTFPPVPPPQRFGGLVIGPRSHQQSQDVGFPFMLDPRFPEDTLFLTFEQDFRWYERDCLPVKEWLPTCLWVSKKEQQEGPEQGGKASSSGSAARESVMQVGPQAGRFDPETTFNFMQLPMVHKTMGSVKPSQLAGRVSPELFELVTTCNLAKRAGHGNVVWFGYNCSDNPKSGAVERVAFGSQGVAFTKDAVRPLLQILQLDTPQLFDLWLNNHLNKDFHKVENHPIDALGRSCFIVPPLGGFYEHETDIAGGKVRPSLFGAWWGQEGSVGAARPTDTPRRLFKWAGQDNPKKYGKLCMRLPPLFEHTNMNLFWKTMLPPKSYERADTRFVEVLSSLGYLADDGSGRYWGPPLGFEEGWKWSEKKGGGWEFKQEPSSKAIRERPDACRFDHEDPSTHLTLLGMKVVAHDPHSPPGSARDIRRIHQAVTMSGYRTLVPWGHTLEVHRV